MLLHEFDAAIEVEEGPVQLGLVRGFQYFTKSYAGFHPQGDEIASLHDRLRRAVGDAEPFRLLEKPPAMRRERVI